MKKTLLTLTCLVLTASCVLAESKITTKAMANVATIGMVRDATMAPLEIRIKIPVWDGSGLFCLWSGTTCTIEIEIVIEFGYGGTGNPSGSKWGVIRTIDGDPVSGDPSPIAVGAHAFTSSQYETISEYDETITIPEQDAAYDSEAGGYVFYYFDNIL